MPRDANGNYTLPAGNPVVSGTLITSSWANTTMGDLSNEMTDSLSRSGKGGFTAPVSIVDKSGSVPGLNFGLEPTSGFKREATEDVRIQVTATDVLQCTKTGVKVLSGGSLKAPVVEETGQKVMRGVGGTTVCYFYNDTPPTGWTLNAPDANIRELVIGPSGGGEGGVIGGTDDPTSFSATVTVSSLSGVANGSTDGHGLTVAEMPPHNHPGSTAQGNFDNSGGPYIITGSSFLGVNPAINVASQGSGNAHSHGFTDVPVTGTGAGTTSTITPRYARGLLATLDA